MAQPWSRSTTVPGAWQQVASHVTCQRPPGITVGFDRTATNRGEPLTTGGQRSWAAVEALQMVKAGDRVDIMWTVALLVSFAEVNK